MFWERRSKSFDNREYWIAGLSATMGAGLGVGFTYFCDPDRGHARRKKVADRAVSLIALGERLVEHKGKNILNRAEGMLNQAGSLFHRQEGVPDEVLLERVRSRLGQVVQHPQSISTVVEEGIVRLTGTVAREEKKCVLREIREVPGVLKVEELLTYEKRRNGKSIPTLLGGLAGAACSLPWQATVRTPLPGALPREAFETSNSPRVRWAWCDSLSPSATGVCQTRARQTFSK